MILNDDNTVTLRPDEAKLFLALALDRRESTAWTSTMVDSTVASLALGLFGKDGRLIAVEDVDRLKHEAHAEYRRG